MPYNAEYHREWRERNKERVAAKQAEWYQQNKERADKRSTMNLGIGDNRAKHAVRVSRWQTENAEQFKAVKTAYANSDVGRAAHRRYTLSEKGRAAGNAGTAKRRARLQAQVCDCCTADDFRPIYKEATSRGLHVDHEKPLAKGGLHCLTNLQLLSPHENMSKGARYA